MRRLRSWLIWAAVFAVPPVLAFPTLLIAIRPLGVTGIRSTCVADWCDNDARRILFDYHGYLMVAVASVVGGAMVSCVIASNAAEVRDRLMRFWVHAFHSRS